MVVENIHDERAYLEVDLKQIKQNTKNIKGFIGDTLLMSVIKGNAYGTGLEPVANVIEAHSDWFAVSTPEEALALRETGIIIPILILGYVADRFVPEIIQNNITVTGLSLEYIKHLNEIIDEGAAIDIHIKIDTGLSRLGLYNEDFDAKKYISEITEILALEKVNVTGIYSHFAVAGSDDKRDLAFTMRQYQIFKAILDEAEVLNLDLGLKHLCNSNAVFDHQDKYFDMVRIGKYIFGFGQEADKDKLNVKTAFNLYARIIRIVEIPKGQEVGYGLTYQAEHKTRLATATFGFTDGFRRNMSGKSKAIVNGEKREIVGRIAADYLEVDITGLPDVKVGDYVLLMGQQGEASIYPSEMGQVIEGSTPEINTQMHARVTKKYIK